jgi:Family of unknown function (DUF6292)
MELELYGAPARGLRRYVWQVAEALGVGPGCCYVQLESPVQAYIPLDERLPRLPGSDVAVTWEASTGWAVGVEDGIGAEVVPLSHLGGDPLPDADVVADFVTGFLAGEPFRETSPEPAADLVERLAAFGRRPVGSQ